MASLTDIHNRGLVPGRMSDHGEHGEDRPIASLILRATLRLSTRSIASSAFSLRGPGQLRPLILRQGPVRLAAAPLAGVHQFPKVPSLMPRSLATCAIERPVFWTSRTAPSLKSWPNFLRVSAGEAYTRKLCQVGVPVTQVRDGGTI
jgi:hypothetical protein